MGFFYSQDELGKGKRSKRKDGHIPVETLRKRSCEVCPLRSAAIYNPRMKPSGDNGAEIYVIGEAPGKNEDEIGEPFVGSSGEFLRRRLPSGFSIRFGNAIQCRPPKNRDPTEVEIQCCWNRVLSDIEEHKPKAIVCVGKIATQRILNDPIVDSIFRWRGRIIPVTVGSHKCWCIPVVHPAAIMRSNENVKYGISDDEAIFVRDLERLADFLEDDYEKPSIVVPNASDVVQVTTLDQFRKSINKVWDTDVVGYDLETRPLRPYAKDAVIATIAIASTEHCFAFPYKHNDSLWSKREFAYVKESLTDFVLNGPIKIAHNLNMELEWSAVEFGQLALEANWGDSMALAYVLDTTKKTLSLEWQSLARLGYNVKALTTDLNMEAMDREPLDRVLPYNGFDAISCLDLWLELLRLTPGSLIPSYERHIRRSRAIVETMIRGIPIDSDRVQTLENRLLKEVDGAREDIANSAEAKEFKEIYGRPFEHMKDADMLALFRDTLERKEIIVERRDRKTNKTETKISFDEAVLESMDGLEIAPAILKYRERYKLLSTYISPLLKKHLFPDGKLHPGINDKFTETSRTSWNEPSIQNWPRRENSWTREIIEAPKDCTMLAFDFGQIEARVIATASGDDKYIDALWKGLDIHMEWAEWFAEEVPGYYEKAEEECGDSDKAKVLKHIRDRAKNKWVFPQFFGASIKSLAEYMKVSERYAEEADQEFWSEFSGVKTWQESLVQEYRECGYITMLSGRRAYGPMSKNMIFNYGIQGFASEIQKHAYCVCSESGYPVVLEIHDDLSFFAPPDDSWVRPIAEIMCTSPLDEYPMIDVPLTIEVKKGKDWAHLEEIAVFASHTDFSRS